MKRPTFEQIEEAVRRSMYGEEYIGFCLSCGEEAYSVEPDAERYTCESCGEPRVYGAEQLMLML